ncbi:helix-turn-helix domain-containing protein [Turicibacter sanguinis]|uniref:helix-turn-helix domain-containing protein n=1 Tax=Turicibacter sanguinis TaxID=154288 RepID=UPI001E5BC71C|nr:helix-turn-helix transcriptional regulator [Turicibacter sanguinis]
MNLVNTQKLKARLVEYGKTQKDIALALELAPSTVSQKINNIRVMNLQEADTIATMLDIDTHMYGEYFFA